MARAIPPDQIIYILLYSVQYERELDDALALARARALLLEPVEGYTPEEEYTLLREAVRPGNELASLVESPIAIPRTDEEFRDFVLRVLDVMDALRPWPELPFIQTGEPPWPDLAQAREIALIHEENMTIETRIHAHFRQTEQDAYWLPLRLNSGDEVAMMAPEWGAAIKVLMREGAGRAPEEVLAAFLHVMPFAPGEVEDLTSGVRPGSRGGAGTGWLAHSLRKARAVGKLGDDTFHDFLRTRLYCAADERGRILGAGPVVPAFTSPEALRETTGAEHFFSTTGEDLLGLLPDGDVVVVDPGTDHAAVFGPSGGREFA